MLSAPLTMVMFSSSLLAHLQMKMGRRIFGMYLMWREI
ncbi:hypothetical protein Atc_0775 [Acidithiobacillus caldus SM-1]|uniref:Uncharacterized protein n=1 Tax=Acidithiobacillus caldus (strain SM-1) TaxID=990288 RepID=F9ZLU2_ACICS|nr:hypothetical protein Atc_0775 [Acidithiobacillus caldus SM-1]